MLALIATKPLTLLFDDPQLVNSSQQEAFWQERWKLCDSANSSPSLNGIEQPLSLAQYHELIRVGILTENDPVELLEGRLVAKMSKKRSHSLTTGLLYDALQKVVPPGWHVDSQEPVTLPDSASEPEPDGMIVRGQRRDFTDRHPESADLALVVEVSDSTLQFDRDEKYRIYAQACIPFYWIVNLRDGQLEVNAEPTGPTTPPDQPCYRQRKIYSPAEMVPLVIGGNEVAQLPVQDLLS